MPDSTQTIAGRTVLITGASSGIGYATALAFARRGANLVVTARREGRLQQLVQEIATIGRDTGAAAIYCAGDAALEDVAQGAVVRAHSRFGSLDILINNAGAGNYQNLVDTTLQDYDALMDANLKSSFLFSRHAAPGMIAQKSGTILFISSVAGLQGAAGEAVYCAAKFAQVGFSQALDAELRRHGIRVGVLCPGGVKTEFAVGKGRTEQSIRDSQMMDPADVAETILFACTQPPNTRIPQLTLRHMG